MTEIGLPGFAMLSRLHPEFAGRRRFFKKLCKRSHALLVLWDRGCEGQTVRHERGADYCDWLGDDVSPLKGTLGFGRTSGYFDPEWSDESAYGALRCLVHWHFLQFDSYGDPVLAEDAPDLDDWRSVIAAAEKIVAGIYAEGGWA